MDAVSVIVDLAKREMEDASQKELMVIIRLMQIHQFSVAHTDKEPYSFSTATLRLPVGEHVGGACVHHAAAPRQRRRDVLPGPRSRRAAV